MQVFVDTILPTLPWSSSWSLSWFSFKYTSLWFLMPVAMGFLRFWRTASPKFQNGPNYIYRSEYYLLIFYNVSFSASKCATDVSVSQKKIPRGAGSYRIVRTAVREGPSSSQSHVVSLLLYTQLCLHLQADVKKRERNSLSCTEPTTFRNSVIGPIMATSRRGKSCNLSMSTSAGKYKIYWMCINLLFSLIFSFDLMWYGLSWRPVSFNHSL